MGSLKRDKGNKGREQIAKVEHWLEIETCTVVPMEPKGKDDKYGISLKHIDRKTEEQNKRSTLSRKKDTGSGTGKIITVVQKFELWFFSKDERDSFFTDINKQIETRTNLVSGHKKAESELSAPKTQRSWTRKGRKDSSNSLPGRTASGTVLNEIEGKYSKQ